MVVYRSEKRSTNSEHTVGHTRNENPEKSQEFNAKNAQGSRVQCFREPDMCCHLNLQMRAQVPKHELHTPSRKRDS